MRSCLFPRVVALAAGLALGCDDRSTLSEPLDGPPAALRTSNNPDGRGAQVIVFDLQGIFINDPDRDFSLWIGVPIGNAPECGGNGEVTGARVHVVSGPSDFSHLVAHVRRQEMVLYGHYHDFCDLPEEDIIGRGRGNADLVVQTREQGLLFGIQATGNVELAGAESAHLVVKGHFQVDSDGALKVMVDRFRLQPIGR
jgi:hypothetical protein